MHKVVLVNRDKLLILQKKSIQILLNSINKEFLKDHFKNLQLPTVYVMFDYETILSVAGISIGLNKSDGDTVPHNYNARQKPNTILQHHQLEI